jgi:hypothetical protein
MTITEITTPLELPPPRTPRSEGVHVSGLIRSIAVKVGFLDAKWCDDLSLTDARRITDQKSILRIRMGLAWEEHLLPTLENVVDHPGEMQLMGVYLSHDGESVDRVHLGTKTLELIVHEVKLTYKSSRGFDLRKQWIFVTQLKAYCKALGTRFARIYILFVCGDYSFPIEPEHKVYELEFTEPEIEETWTMLIDYYHHRLEEEAA